MKLTKKDAELLDYLAKHGFFGVPTVPQPTIKEVAIALSIRKSNLTNRVKKLEKLHLIAVERKGRSKQLWLNYSIRLAFFKTTLKFPFAFKDILSGRTPFLLASMKKQGVRIKNLGIPAISAKRMLSMLSKLGIIFKPSRGIYRLRDAAFPIADFCRTILTQIHVAEAEDEMPSITNAVVSFDGAQDVEAIFVAEQESEPVHYWPTSYSVFHEHGIRLISAGKYYYSSIKPDLRDVVIHTLALGRDTRSIAYISALMIKNNFDCKSLLGKRQRFNLPVLFIKNLIAFAESKGKKAFQEFPNWGEVEAIAYG